MKLVYTTDIHGKEILQNEKGNHQVMMEWEKPYMQKCIDYLDPVGSVLEIGFGLGYSAKAICFKKNVKKYTIIECSPIVWKKIEEFKTNILEQRSDIKIYLVKGRWEDVLSEVGVFDCVFFDDYSGDERKFVNMYNRFNQFLHHMTTNKHTHPLTKFGVYSNCKIENNIPIFDVVTHEFKVTIPKNCKYARGDTMYIPIYTQKEEYNEITKDTFDQINIPQISKKLTKNVIKLNEFYNKQHIYCNLLVIDNFYNNAKKVRKYILTQEFKVRGNYPGQRTTSRANNHLKEIIQRYIEPFAGKITDFPLPEEGKDTYNGAFQYTTSRDRTWIHNDGWNNWAGVLYLTPNAPVDSGTGIFRYKDGTRTVSEARVKDNVKLLDSHSQDYTKWELVDKVGNIFNRLILFNSTQYHASLEYFGTNKENGRLFQVFFFSTEK